MYYRFFGLDGPPFAITPDPKFVFFSERHQEALAHLLYGIGQGGGGGFVQLTGEVGTGKTTLCRLLFEQLPGDVQPALILNPVLGPRELIAAICDELGVPYPKRATRKQLVDRLNAHLLDVHGRGGTVVLVIDEAQNLSPQALEQVRLLTNLETHQAKLLQIILIGQPELRDVLDRPGLRQLAQRITARYHLEPLSETESAEYVRHRLRVAGAPRCPFTPAALSELHRRADGVPRLLNVIADRALLSAYTDGAERIRPRDVRAASAEVLPAPATLQRWRRPALAAALALAVGAGLWFERDRLDFGAGGEARPTVAAMGAERAWEQAANWWDVDWPDRATGCPVANDHGLACLRAEGGWREITELRVPVMLRLLDGDGWVVLNGADAGHATLLYSGERLPRAALGARWSGEYVVLVRLPAELPGTLEPGDEGPGVSWLRQRARELDGTVASSESGYDEDLQGWIESFQRQVGLPATGIADPATLVLIAARTNGAPVSG